MDKYPTGKPIWKLTSNALKSIDKNRKMQTGRLAGIWKEVVGKEYATMSEVIKFQEQTLYIKVHSATLYSIYAMQEKGELLNKVQKKIPALKIKNIIFRR